MKKIVTSSLVLASTLALAFAQQATYVPPATAAVTTANTSALLGFLGLLQRLVNDLVPFAVGLAVLAFFWFLIKFIFKGGEEGDARRKALSGMGLSIVALFAMVSIWGLVGFIGSVTGIGQGGSVPIPGVPRPCPAGVSNC